MVERKRAKVSERLHPPLFAVPALRAVETADMFPVDLSRRRHDKPDRVRRRVGPVMIPFSSDADLLRMIRLAPAHLRSDEADFIRHVYREALDRQPEFDPTGADIFDAQGDIYSERTNYIRLVVTSDECLNRGYDAALNAFAAMLGYGRHRSTVVAALRGLYPSRDAFVSAADDLIARVRENSRRQDLIVAMCSAA